MSTWGLNQNPDEIKGYLTTKNKDGVGGGGQASAYQIFVTSSLPLEAYSVNKATLNVYLCPLFQYFQSWYLYLSCQC